MPTKPKNNEKGNPERDRFYTPYYGIEPIFEYIPKQWYIWESAAGEGHIVQAFEDRGHTVIAGDITTGQNYFDDKCVPEDYDCQITNTPFSMKYKWLERAYLLGRPFALLMPSDTLFAASAQRLFTKYGWSMLLPSQRIDYKTPNKGWDSSAQMSTAWFAWKLPNLPQGITFVKLNKPKKINGIAFTDEQMRQPVDKSEQFTLF